MLVRTRRRTGIGWPGAPGASGTWPPAASAARSTSWPTPGEGDPQRLMLGLCFFFWRNRTVGLEPNLMLSAYFFRCYASLFEFWHKQISWISGKIYWTFLNDWRFESLIHSNITKLILPWTWKDMDDWCELAKINHEEQELHSEFLTVGSSQEFCYLGLWLFAASSPITTFCKFHQTL
jgi:hypothetical protein